MHSFKTLLFVLILFMLLPDRVPAQWSDDPAVNTPVCTLSDAGYNQNVRACTDGAGGIIIVWGDRRKEKTNTGGDIFAQRLDAAGNALWNANGVMICDTTGEQNAPCIVGDNAGGAYIAWIDARTGQYTGNVYLQKINAAGQTMWERQGRKITAGANTWFSPAMTTDGTGGVILAYRYGVDPAGIFAQRVSPDGTSLWAAGGVAVSPTGYHNYPVVEADDSSGVYIAWSLTRGDGLINSYIQRLTSSGTKRFAAAGVPFRVQAASQGYNRLVNMGQGQVMAAWYDERATNYVRQIYVQRFHWNGAPQFMAGGKPVTHNLIDAYYVYMVPDSAGGAFVAYWANNELRAIGVKGNGIARWDSSAGTIFCSAARERYVSDMVLVERGRAVVAWYDYRDYTYENGNCNVYVQSFDTLGTVHWTANGIPITTAPVDQTAPVVVPTINGGVIAAWKDNRNGTTSLPSCGIYAQRINSHGGLTGINAEGPTTAIAGRYVLMQNFPNPFNPATTIRYGLPHRSPVSLSLFNTLGQRVATLVQGEEEMGFHEVRFNAAGLSSGVYFYTLTTGDFTHTRTLVLIR